MIINWPCSEHWLRLDSNKSQPDPVIMIYISGDIWKTCLIKKKQTGSVHENRLCLFLLALTQRDAKCFRGVWWRLSLACMCACRCVSTFVSLIYTISAVKNIKCVLYLCIHTNFFLCAWQWLMSWHFSSPEIHTHTHTLSHNSTEVAQLFLWLWLSTEW